MSQPTVGESKPAKAGKYTVRQVRKNRRVVAELRAYQGQKNRLIVLHMKRRTDHEDHRDQTWQIDADVVAAAKLYGVNKVCLEVEDGRRLLIDALLVGPAGAAQGVKVVFHRSKNPKVPGERRWYVPSSLFAIHTPEEDERENNLIARMRIAGSRA